VQRVLGAQLGVQAAGGVSGTRPPDAAQRPLPGGAQVAFEQAVLDQAMQLDDADALGRDGHHHAGEARLGLAYFQGVHRFAALAELGGEIGQSEHTAGAGGVLAELGAEGRVHQQPFDQLAGLLRVLVSG
jgi:hypothetical protein